MIWRVLLLLFVPLTLVLHRVDAPPLLQFTTAALALLPLGAWVHLATERLATRLGPVVGGLINIAAANGTELVITIFALSAGFVGVVKATLVGSILSNMLFIMGLGMLVGGICHPVQKIDHRLVSATGTQLVLAVAALSLPTLAESNHWSPGRWATQVLTVGAATVMLAIYLLGTAYTLRTADRSQKAPVTSAVGRGLWSSLLILVACAGATVAISDILIKTLEPALASLHLPQRIAGLILVPLLGNAGENVTAVLAARENRMTLAYQIAVGSSTQIALLVAPLLVFAGLLMGKPFLFVFHPLEVMALGLSVLLAVLIHLDARSNWLEGTQLLAGYILFILALCFLE
ncbi:MAG: calcium/proton exchanger [Limnochordales bacterium]|nr:calcium/proton exchanger [Limnochordales bacterium]